MGMEAKVFMIGRHKKELVKHYDYPPSCYENVPEGTILIQGLISCPGTSSSTDLGRALGLDPWGFETHRKTNLDGIDWEALREVLGRLVDYMTIEDTCQALRDYIGAGWSLYYLPNG